MSRSDVGPSKECMKRAYDKMFEPNPWFYELQKQKRKEVRKEMAIDYGREWKKLKGKHGLCRINVKGKQVHLKQVMDNQIDDTIVNREKLMQEYVRTRVQTEIIGGDQNCHIVKLIVRGNSRGTIPVGKDAFQAWIKREKGGKCNEVF